MDRHGFQPRDDVAAMLHCEKPQTTTTPLTFLDTDSRQFAICKIFSLPMSNNLTSLLLLRIKIQSYYIKTDSYISARIMLNSEKLILTHISMEAIMRQISKILAMALMALLFAGSAWAAPTLGSGFNYISFTNYENIVSAEGNELGTVGVGDIFYGIANIDSINWASTFTSPDWVITPGVQYIQSYFLTEVKNVIDLGDGVSRIEFGVASYDPNNVFSDSDLALGTVLKWFESDTVLDFTTFGSSLASAIDGDLWLSLSIDDGYWYSEAKSTYAGLANGAGLGTSYYGLNRIDGTVNSLQKINDENEYIADMDVDFYGKATIELMRSGDSAFGKWLFYSDDPAVVATPEPGTLLLLGAGLLGLGAVARRRKN